MVSPPRAAVLPLSRPVGSHGNEDIILLLELSPLIPKMPVCCLQVSQNPVSLANQSLGLPGLGSPQANREGVEKEQLHEVTRGPVFYCGRKVGSIGVWMYSVWRMDG